ncbi:MAG: protein kinase family protein [Nocardioides sp.]
MTTSIRSGDVLAGRYHLVDLLAESKDGRFWRAHDTVLDRPVAVHVIRADDDRADGLLEAARLSARVLDRRILRVLDADVAHELVFVVNEWGEGTSLDILLADEPLEARRAGWIAGEVGAALATAHAADVAHGRLVPENVLLDVNGEVRVIGLAVDAALHGLPPGRRAVDIADLAGILYAGLTGRWSGVSTSVVPDAHVEGGRLLRPRQVRAGIPRPLDELCDQVLNPPLGGTHARTAYDLGAGRRAASRTTCGPASETPPT